MLKLEWIILISASLAILSLIMFSFFFSQFVRIKKNISKFGNDVKKKGDKRKKIRRELKKLEQTKRSNKKNMLFFGILLVLSIAIGSYAEYYQLTNMTETDTENIVTSFYLIEQIEKKLAMVSNKDETDSAEQLSENIHTLAARMATFSSRKGNDRASEEGQLLLNRYYARVGQLGVNLSSQQYETLALDETVISSYLDDTKNVKQAQKKVLDFYKINESSLSQKK